MTNEEKLIKFLNSKFESSNTNTVFIHKNELPQIGLSEQETIRAIHLLKEDEIITDIKMATQNDLSIPCRVSLKSSCVHYFENKKTTDIENRRGWVKSYGTSILSIIAIIISIIALIID